MEGGQGDGREAHQMTATLPLSTRHSWGLFLEASRGVSGQRKAINMFSSIPSPRTTLLTFSWVFAAQKSEGILLAGKASLPRG